MGEGKDLPRRNHVLSAHRSARVLASIVALATPYISTANPYYWTGNSGNWNTVANWALFGNSTHAVPTAGDSANLDFTDGVPRTIIYNYPGPDITLTSVEINLSHALPTDAATLIIPGGNLSANTTYIGGSQIDFGTGAVIQTGGTLTVGSSGDGVALGYNAPDIGNYSLSGTGSLNSYVERIGYSGSGNFTQSGGVNTISGYSLFLGYKAGSNGTYLLSNGSLSVAQFATNEYIGYGGTANFVQSGGINSISAFGFLSLGNQTGSSGNYTLTAGTLSAGGAEIGYHGNGTFTQTGGTFNVSGAGGTRSLTIGARSGATGDYILSGGTLSVAATEAVGFVVGTFTQTGGIHTITAGHPLYVGGYFVGGSGSYLLSGGALSVGGDMYVGGNGVGTFTSTGPGTLTVGGTLIVRALRNIHQRRQPYREYCHQFEQLHPIRPTVLDCKFHLH